MGQSFVCCLMFEWEVGQLGSDVSLKVVGYGEENPVSEWQYIQIGEGTRKESLKVNKPPQEGHLRIVCVGCTHGNNSNFIIPEGDLLIHCGDLCGCSTYDSSALKAFKQDFLSPLIDKKVFPHGIIMIPGNHDYYSLTHSLSTKKLLHTEHSMYLQDEMALLQSNLLIFGSPMSCYRKAGSYCYQLYKRQSNGKLFPKPEAKYPSPTDSKIISSSFPSLSPGNLDILITHGPPKGIGDGFYGTGQGSYKLLQYTNRIKPKLHVFSDWHGLFEEPYHGVGIHRNPDYPDTVFVNCAQSYNGGPGVKVLRHQPILIDFPIPHPDSRPSKEACYNNWLENASYEMLYFHSGIKNSTKERCSSCVQTQTPHLNEHCPVQRKSLHISPSL